MGEVYRARDTRLDRTVAIKILRETHPDLKSRFAREAKAIAALAHPHICTLFDIGREVPSTLRQSSGQAVDFLVMECLDGETLAARLKRGALPVDQALKTAIDIGDALDSAHRAGLTHRDLKPSNVMLTKSGASRQGSPQAKLLDFGLAKFHAVPRGAGETVTITQSLSGEGMLVGTVPYMAPEQLEGREADARSDLFAFGAMLYEMLTGRRAFAGESHASVIAAILKTDPPPIGTSQPLTPPALDRVVHKCLAKDPDTRWQTARDLVDELKWIADIATPEPALVASRAHWLRHGALPWVLAGALAFGLTLVVVRWAPGRTAPQPAIQFVVPAPENTILEGDIAVSPDGRRLAFLVNSDGRTRLAVRALDSLEITMLPGTEGASRPFWKPDGRFIGFFASGKLQKVPVSGGPPETLCDAQAARGGTWNREGTIVFAPNTTSGLYRVADVGGPMTPVTVLNRTRQEIDHRFPQFLPDGRHFIYLAESSVDQNKALFAGSLDSKESKYIAASGSRAMAAAGFLFLALGTTLVAQPFDASMFELKGEPVVIGKEVNRGGIVFGSADFSVSDTGVLAYRGDAPNNSQLLWFDREGNLQGSVGLPGDSGFALSPDNNRVAVTRFDKQSRLTDIWLLDLTRSTSERLTAGPRSAMEPLWSPDGSRIVFRSDREGPANWSLYEKASNGLGNEDLLLKLDNNSSSPDWSSDGRSIAFASSDPKTGTHISVLSLSGDQKPVAYLQTRFREGSPRFSPDGRWIAYSSDENGRPDVYVQSFPAGARKWLISTSGGSAPRWRADGKELFYVGAGGKLMIVSVTAGTSFEAGIPKPLFQTKISGGYNVTRNGQRFLIETLTGENTSPPITVLVNWTAALPSH